MMGFKKKKDVVDVVAGSSEVDVGLMPPRPPEKVEVVLDPAVKVTVDGFQERFGGVYGVPQSAELMFGAESCALALALLHEVREGNRLLGELLEVVRKE